jgi:hypothetical protein
MKQSKKSGLPVPNEKTWHFFLALALLAGLALRFSFPNDIEYKGDERFMFQTGQAFLKNPVLPLLGMGSGIGIRNPGMSVWIFDWLSEAFRVRTPQELARAVQCLDTLGLLALALFAFKILPPAEREPWRWATVLAAVNPFAVLFQRKIWAQSTLPFFGILFWIAWYFRHKRLGAFFWGLLGACLGQVHMSGFFFAGGVFLWTFLKDRAVKWGAWAAGTCLGAVPLVYWARYVVSAHPGNGFNWLYLLWPLDPRYWFFWITDALGLGQNYSLKLPEYLDFMRYPLVAGHGTYLVAALHLLILFILGSIVFQGRQKNRDPQSVEGPETREAIRVSFWGAGILMTLACFKIFRHYLIVTFPMEWVWFSSLGLRRGPWGARALMIVWIAQLLLSISFLGYIHVNNGDPQGDYGTVYHAQTPGPSGFPEPP